MSLPRAQQYRIQPPLNNQRLEDIDANFTALFQDLMLLAERFRFGEGSPEGEVEAPIGTIYLNTAQTAYGTTLYVKESGSGSTGWVAK